MNTKEALRLVAFGSDLFANDRGQAAFDRLEADAQAMWAVRVLDAYARREQLDAPYVPVWVGDRYKLDVEDRHGPEWLFFGDSPDAARIAAATALVTAEPLLDPDLSPAMRQVFGRMKRTGQGSGR